MVKPRILRMKDSSDDYVIKKEGLDSVPFRLAISGKSGVGKTNIIGSLLLLKENYGGLFKGENVWIFSPMKNDVKMMKIIEMLDVPKDNLFENYNDEILNNIYDEIVDKFEERVNSKKSPEPTLIILDDITFDGSIAKKFSAVNRCFMNLRKHFGSILVCTQKWSQISTGQRANASSILFFNSNIKEKNLFETDANYLKSSKMFFKMLDDNLKSKRDFIYVDFSQELVKDMYKDKNFDTIDISKYE